MKRSNRATPRTAAGCILRESARVPTLGWLFASLPACLVLMICGCATGGAGSVASLFSSKGAPWTIQCLELQGPDCVQQVEEVAETLRRTSGIRPKDVFVKNDSHGPARLYYGTYFRRSDRGKGMRPIPAGMRRDMNLIRQLGDGSGQRYFGRAMPVRMPTPDVGNPDWALANVSANYSLQVAAFEPGGDFWQYKLAAAQYCALLRKKGYEAYYDHGRACSVVTIGAFGPEAVITRPNGRAFYSSEVLALQRNELFQYNLVNGAIMRVRIEGGESVPVPSRLVEIPHPQESDPW